MSNLCEKAERLARAFYILGIGLAPIGEWLQKFTFRGQKDAAQKSQKLVDKLRADAQRAGVHEKNKGSAWAIACEVRRVYGDKIEKNPSVFSRFIRFWI